RLLASRLAPSLPGLLWSGRGYPRSTSSEISFLVLAPNGALRMCYCCILDQRDSGHESSPLPGGARVRVDTYDAEAGSCFANKRLEHRRLPCSSSRSARRAGPLPAQLALRVGCTEGMTERPPFLAARPQGAYPDDLNGSSTVARDFSRRKSSPTH